jgi:hypothetical protein
MSENIITALYRHINDEVDRVQAALVDGHATDYPTYQRLVGYAAAMKDVKNFLEFKEDE